MAEVIDLDRKPTKQTIISWLHEKAEECRHQGRFDTAIAYANRAIALDPSISNPWNTLGSAYCNKGEFDKGLSFLQKAVDLEPNANNWGSIALAYHSLRMYSSAEWAYQQWESCEKIEKDRLGGTWDRALMRLEQGLWTENLPDYDSRLSLRPDLYGKLPMPLWQGEPLDGKSIFVRSEQGIGDQILFSRYFEELKRRWPTCEIHACFPHQLDNFFWCYRDIVNFYPSGVPWPDPLWDYGVFQASLPRWLGTTPETVPADPGRFRARADDEVARGRTKGIGIPHLPSLKIGVAWTGNPIQNKNFLRSIPLEKVLVLAENPRHTLYSFQVGQVESDLDRLDARELIYDLGPMLAKEGLVGASAAMLEMDVIVTVCTATAHLAGALGIPCLTMLSWDPYWIWLQGNEYRPRTPWYPKMELFRQDRPGDWDSVIGKVLTRLEEFALAKGLAA